MRHTIPKINVDAGCFIIADKQWFVDRGAPVELSLKDKEGQAEIKLPMPGRYAIDYKVKKTWNGKLKDTENIDCPTGILWITDGCYVCSDEKWQDMCGTSELDDSDDHHIMIQTGGDGEFRVHLGYVRIGACKHG